jgi:2-polyprenyl-3-methyl-5-hydroxy-6-metoxy-1,4-benzoquinol methylase
MINNRLEPTDSYYQHLRMHLLLLAGSDIQDIKVLEIGCAAGQSLSYFKQNGAAYTVGVELVPEVAQMAMSRPEIDKIIIGNIETIDLEYPEGYFDLVVVGHVLEHVTNPWDVLSKVVTYIRPGGKIIGSLPNVRHLSVIIPLIFSGDWEYQSVGILDWTHYRFFTKKTVQQLLESANLKVDCITPEVLGKKSLLLSLLTMGLFDDFIGYTNNFAATKK